MNLERLTEIDTELMASEAKSQKLVDIIIPLRQRFLENPPDVMNLEDKKDMENLMAATQQYCVVVSNQARLLENKAKLLRMFGKQVKDENKNARHTWNQSVKGIADQAKED